MRRWSSSCSWDRRRNIFTQTDFTKYYYISPGSKLKFLPPSSTSDTPGPPLSPVPWRLKRKFIQTQKHICLSHLWSCEPTWMVLVSWPAHWRHPSELVLIRFSSHVQDWYSCKCLISRSHQCRWSEIHVRRCRARDRCSRPGSKLQDVKLLRVCDEPSGLILTCCRPKPGIFNKMIRLLNPCLWQWNGLKGDNEHVQLCLCLQWRMFFDETSGRFLLHL